MNKIFKVIWSKARNCYVVVSEIAHCQGKGKGQKRAVLTCSLAAALTVFTLAGGIVSVQAVETVKVTGGTEDVINVGTDSIVIGPNAKNKSNSSDGVIVIGHNAIVDNNGKPKDSIAIGTSANVVGENNIAIGTNAAVTNNGGNNAISLGTKATAEKSESIAIGMNAHANNNDGIAAIAIGSGSEAQKDKSIAIGYQALAKNNEESGGIAIGSSTVDSQGKIIRTTATQGNDIAFGVGAQTDNNNMNEHHGGAIAIGHLSYSKGYQDVAIGDNAKTGRIGTEGEGYVAIGANSFSNVGPGVVGYGYDFHDFQTKGSQTNEYAAVWKSTNGAVSVGNVSDSDYTKWITRQITGVAAGSADTDAVNVAQLKAAISSVNTGSSSSTSSDGVHYYSVLSDEKGSGSNYDNQGAKGQNSLAAGVSASATGAHSVAVGNGAQAVGPDSIALGTNAKAEGQGALVVGNHNSATGQNAVAFGGGYDKDEKGNMASATASLAFGENTVARAEGAVAFGYGTQAGSEQVDNNGKNYGQDAVAFGNGTKALGGRSLAFGERTLAEYTNAVAFGADTQSRSNGATAFGSRTRAMAQYSTAFGNRSVAAGNYATAFGTDTLAGVKTDASGAMWLTNGTKIDSNGNEAYTDTDGNTYAVKGFQNVKNGQPSGEIHDYVVVKGKDDNPYIQDYHGDIHAVTLTKQADGTVVATASTDILKNVTLQAAAPTSTAGYDFVDYDNATAFGESTKAINVNATALGKNSVASGENSLAFGEGSTATGNNSVAGLGGTVAAEAANAVAIGKGAQAELADSVALGSHSVTTRAKYKDLTAKAEKEAYAKGASTGSAWEATDNAIAVGNDSTVTRQITGVAAGSLDTDAVNVAQLRAVDAKHTIVTVGGQSATADNTPVNGGNLDLKRTTATNGQETYDLSLDKNVTLGKQVENEGGKLTVNNVDKFKNYDKNSNPLPDTTVKEAVKIDGKTVSVVKHDGSDADNDQRQVVLGVDQDAGGYVTLYDNTGKKPTYIYNAISGGITYLKDKDSYLTPDPTNPNDERASNEFNRLEYGDYHTGTVQFIATLDDGQKYAGDNYQAAETETKTVDGKTTTTVTKEEQNVLLKKLNERLDIKGGATGTLTDNNIGVNIENGVMKVQLAQNIDLGGSGSVTMGNTTINNGGVIITTKDGDKVTNTISLTDNGLNNGGKTITNVEGGTNPTDAVNVSQLNASKTTVTSNDHSVTIDTTTDSTDNHKNYDLKIATATLSPEKTTGDKPVETGKVAVTNPTYTGSDGKPVTNENAYVTGKSVADAINNSGFKLIASKSEGDVTGNAETLIHPGDTVTIDAGKNISLIQDNGKISIATKNNLNLGSADSKDDKQQDVPGVDGSITVNGKNGSSVAINGQDGSIGLTGPKGKDGTSTSIQMSTILSDPTLDDGKNAETTTSEGEQQKTTIQAPRIQYKNDNTTYKVATMDDGQKYGGDNYVAATDKAAEQNVITKKLNERLDIKGGATGTLTDNNIGVNVKDGVIKVQLAQNLDLTDTGSVKMGNTTINNGGVTITPTGVTEDKDKISLTDKGLSNGGKQITHVDSGLKDAKGNTVALKDATGDVLNNAVNVGDLQKVQNIASAHTTVSVGGQKAQKNGKEVKGGNLILTRTQDEATHAYNYDVKLGNDITVGEKGADGKDGKIGVNGKDGSSVVINGKDGSIGLTGPKGADGTPGASLTMKAENGRPGLNGKDGTTMTRIVYDNHEVATLDDGLKFAGDDGQTNGKKVIRKKLNEKLDIVGGADAKKLTDKNIGVNNVGGQLKIQLAKDIDLTKSGSVKMGDTTINNTGLTIQDGPSITKTNIDAGSKTIINVAPGKNGTDAVNVNQLNEVKNVASAHSTVSVGGQKAQKNGKEVKGGNLILTRTQDKDTHAYNYDVKLGNDITVGEKGAHGKDGKISVNGKDGSSVVINGKDGTIGLNGKNGTNGLTIRGAAGKDGITRIVYKDAAGKDHPVATLEDGLNFKGDDSTVIPKKLNKRMDIVGGANKNNLSENNIGVISDNGKLHVKLAKDLKDLTSVTTTDGKGNTTVQNDKGVTVKDSQNNTATFTAKDITFTNQDKSYKTKLDEDGLTIFTKGASGQSNQTIKITNTYISMGGQQIHNVSAGKADTDAVNVSQLKAVQSVAEAHSTVSVGGKKAGKDSVDVKGGNLVLKRTENTNGSKNYDVKLADDISIKSVTTTDDKGNKTVQKGGGITTIDKDGNKTSVTGKGVTTVDKDGNKTSLTGKGMTTVDKDGNKTSVTGKGVSISGKDGNKTIITEKGLTIKDGPVVTKDKFSAGGQQIHDVEAGTAPKDAVNVSQLNDEIRKVEQHHTEVTVNGGTKAQEGTYNPSGNLQIKKTTDKDTGKKTYDLKLADNLTFGAKDGSDGKEGVDGSIGVNGRNGSAVVINGQDGSIGLNGADGKNGLTIKGADGTVGVDGKAGTTRLIYETKDGEKTVKHEVATMDDGMKYSGDSGNAAVKLNKNVQIYGGATEYADGNNIGVVASQDGDNAKLQVKLAKDLKGINSIEAKTITTGDTTMDNSGLTVKGDDNHKDITIHQGNVNMGGNKVSGVADGKVSKDSTDAVNGSQLWQRDQAINSLGGAVNKLDSRVNRVGAGAAALAALHPLDFDPDDKWDFAAGYGNYRGANAAAVGAYYRPNEDTMFSVGGSFGGGENMVNAGVSIKLGQGNHVSTSRVAMAKEIKDLRQNVANLNAIVNRQSALIDKLTGTNAGMIKDKGNDLFPDVPANHWAYEYVTRLKHAGILTGYPDGNFDGDRMMTRYEFAAIVYRAIMAGAASNPALNQDGTLDKLANEFSSEMKYIRIDTIAKDKNGKPTIERVRVISDAK